MKSLLSVLLCLIFIMPSADAQIDEDQLGGWYMLFWNTSFGDSQWGLQGDIQLRNWEVAGDLEQLLIRGGVTYKATDNALLTLGYGNITTGEFGDSDETVSESRIYQEALIDNKIGSMVYLKHRFRYEQRWVDDQDLRTRYRYNLFLTIPLAKEHFATKTAYLSFYNELFVNGQRDIGNGASVQLFDRNRFYGAVGYVLAANHKIQLGMMRQKTNTWAKNQLQLSLHSKF